MSSGVSIPHEFQDARIATAATRQPSGNLPFPTGKRGIPDIVKQQRQGGTPTRFGESWWRTSPRGEVPVGSLLDQNFTLGIQFTISALSE
jgi:hypothetical protein